MDPTFQLVVSIDVTPEFRGPINGLTFRPKRGILSKFLRRIYRLRHQHPAGSAFLIIMPEPPDPSYSHLMSTKDESTKPSLQRPIYRLKCSVSDSSTLVDAQSSTFKPKIVDSHIDESPVTAEDEDDSDEGWIDGEDYPQFVINHEKSKTITASDMKRCITRFFENSDSTVIEGGRRVMPRVIPVSPPMTEENLTILREAMQGLNKAVAEGRGELSIFSPETLFTECACFSDKDS